MERQTHIIDAKGRSLGRIATEVATLLRGKQKPGFMVHKDDGDFVVVENASKMKLTGKKENQKRYYRHSGYLGGLKEETISSIESKRPGETLRKAVMGMLPKNRLRSDFIKRLTIKQ